MIRATILAAALLLAAVPEPQAGPSVCMFPGTTGRAVRVVGAASLPSACAMNVCRTAGKLATKVVPCGADPSCAGKFPYVEQWKAEGGGWSALPACPAWTNAAGVWQI